MASKRLTFTLDVEVARLARRLDIDIPAAARNGVMAAVRAALSVNDRTAYQRHPERHDPSWSGAEAWCESIPD